MYIECIEKDNYKPLPGGIFNKGFVKSYARFIGFDENEAIQDYARIAAQSEGTDNDHLRAYRPEVLTDDNTTRSTLPTILFAGIILALMTGGILFLLNYLQSQPALPPIASNTSTTNQPERPSNTPPGSAEPTMQNLKVEFRSTTEPISLSATSDGKNSINTVTVGGSIAFEPRESLKLSYSKSLSASAQLVINGKQITLPAQPANPKRIPIEVEINASNLSQIWNNGQISFDAPQPTNTAPTPASTRPPETTTNTATPRPATPEPTVRTTPVVSNATRPRLTPTPIIAGGNRNAAPGRTPN